MHDFPAPNTPDILMTITRIFQKSTVRLSGALRIFCSYNMKVSYIFSTRTMCLTFTRQICQLAIGNILREVTRLDFGIRIKYCARSARHHICGSLVALDKLRTLAWVTIESIVEFCTEYSVTAIHPARRPAAGIFISVGNYRVTRSCNYVTYFEN